MKALPVRISGRLLLFSLLLINGCASEPARRQLHAPTAFERARAAVAAAERNDPEAVPALVNLLEDFDPAVRLFAIQSLARLSGTTYGYSYHASEESRAAAVGRWRAALQAGEVRLAHTPATDAAPGHRLSADDERHRAPPALTAPGGHGRGAEDGR